MTEFSGALDENSCNVAFIIINYLSEKKPISDRRSYNWGTSQTHRGSITFYPCLRYFMCEKCNEGSTDDGNCHSCNVKLKQRICPAKKYIYFCRNTCVRKFYKACCETPNHRRACSSLCGNTHMDKMMKKNSSQLKEVETNDDIIENLHTLVGNEDADFNIEKISKVPSDIDGNQ